MSQNHRVHPETALEPGSSKRYKSFYSALQLATQSAASKWTYEDFKICFPTYCEEFPVKAQTLRTEMARNIFEVTKQESDKLLEKHHAALGTDILHEVVLEARAKKQAGQDMNTPDAWVPNLDPRTAVHARTIPLLNAEYDRIRLELEELAAENQELIAELALNDSKKREYEEKTMKGLDALDETVDFLERINLEPAEQWSMDLEERLGSRM